MTFYNLHALANPWKKYNLCLKKKTVLHIAGWLNEHEVKSLKDAFKNSVKQLLKWLYSHDGHFAFIIEDINTIYLATDKVSSFPLFYCDYNKFCVEINSASSCWINEDFSDDINIEKTSIYQMTGYTIGRSTLRKSVKRVLPGELCVISKKANSYNIKNIRYYLFYPDFNKLNKKLNFIQLYDQLDVVINKAIKRLINQAKGRTIILSLSAGFDSRLILGKLLEFKYKNIFCFSYGIKNNFEALEAKKIAQRQNVRWCFVPDLSAKEKQLYFNNGKLKDYFVWSSGLTTTAAMTEFVFLEKLLIMKPELRNGVFTNGQSGDFITGGHLLKINNYNLKDDFLNSFFKKHFSLLNKNEITQITKNKIFNDWLISSQLDKMVFSNYYSVWSLMEWQERQAYYVVNQQRASDFLNIEWSMPLWDGCIMKFFQNVPLEWQLNQKLYSRYLGHWNYNNLFKPLRVSPSSGGKFWFLFIILAQIIKLILGNKTKDNFYKLLDYYSSNNFQYNFFPFFYYLKNYKKIRNVVSLFNQKHYNYLIKNGKKIPESLL